MNNREKTVKISVVVPVYGTECLRNCISSLTAQTLQDIEIVAVCDGDPDALKILTELAQTDQRIRVLYNAKNRGLGYSINRGIREARADYIGQVNSDDTVIPFMYERLYEEADGCDIIKGGFYYCVNGERIPSPVMDMKTEFCPSSLSPMKQLRLFLCHPSFCSGIYRRDFLVQKDLFWNETPGAAFQDTSAVFRCNAEVERMKLLPELFYYWRIHADSASHGTRYPFDVRYEYKTITDYLDAHAEKKELFRDIASRLRYGTYVWNVSRISAADRPEFIRQAAEDFRKDYDYQDCSFYSKTDLRFLLTWMNHPERIIRAFEENTKS